MASSKVMSSSASRNSDLRRRSSSSASSKPSPISDPHHHHINHHHHQANNDGVTSSSVPMTVDGDNHSAAVTEGMLLDAEITLLDAAGAVTAISDNEVNHRGLEGTAAIRRQESGVPAARKTLDEVWREMVEGRIQRKECKQEAPDEMMTLEDFLARAGAVEDNNVKVEPLALSSERVSGGIFSFDSMPLSRYSSQHSVDSMMGFGSGSEGIGGRGKKRAVLEPLDKAAQQRQRRMIKNRESAARSRERKQAYQAELESLAAKLEEENDKLLKEKAEKTQVRLKQLMENIIPVVVRRKPKRPLRRVCSMDW